MHSMQGGRSWQVANSPSKTKRLASSLATGATVILTLLCQGMLTNNLDFRITVPDSITAQRGFCIHVPCSFTTPDWYKRSSEPLYGYWFRITDRKTYLEGTNIWVPGELKASNDERQTLLKLHSTHMKLSGDPEEGDCSFTIINTGLDDRGRYYFRIDKGEGYRYSFNPSSSQTHTNPQVVLTDLKKPKIIKPHEVIWEKSATFRCIAAEMCPGTKPQITWPTEPDIHPVYSTSSWNTQQSNWSSTYGVDITFKPSLADDGIVLTCSIKYHFLKKAVHVATRLSFGYRPTASTILPNAACENEDLGHLCTCSFHCWPPPTLMWEVDGVAVTGNRSTSDMEVLHWTEGNAATSTLLWKGASVDQYDPFITCTATNPFGKQTVVILPGSNKTNGPPPPPYVKMKIPWVISAITLGSLIVLTVVMALVYLGTVFNRRVYVHRRDATEVSTMDAAISHSMQAPQQQEGEAWINRPWWRQNPVNYWR